MNIQKSELDAVVEAGRILVTSGAEVYRVEETMKHMAEVFGITNFESYVVNGAVIVSEGEKQRLEWPMSLQSRSIWGN